MSVAIPRLSATVLLLSQNAPALRAANLATTNNNDKTQSLTHETKNDFINNNKCTSDFKVLMVKRHDKARFMPNKYVFPGGSVEKNDVEYANLLQIPVQRFIALRELSEETHCVLRASGSLCSSTSWEKHEERNKECDKSKSKLNLEKKNNKMSCCGYDVEAASRLILLARWITPPKYPYRYDTYFYGAIVDNDSNSNENHFYTSNNSEQDSESCTKCTHAQEITLQHQTKELTEANWYAPLDILRKHEATCGDDGNCSVAPITYFMLHALAQYESLQEIKQLWSELTCNCHDSFTTTVVADDNDDNTRFNIDEKNIRAVISEEDTPDDYFSNKQLDQETRMRIPANYIVRMGRKALLPPGHYNIVKECVSGVQRITHLTIDDTSTPNDNKCNNKYDDEVVLRH